MASLDYMKIDLERVMKEASAGDNDRKSHPFHLSAKVVAKFKESCEKAGVPNSRVLEVFMQQFSDFVDNKKK